MRRLTLGHSSRARGSRAPEQLVAPELVAPEQLVAPELRGSRAARGSRAPWLQSSSVAPARGSRARGSRARGSTQGVERIRFPTLPKSLLIISAVSLLWNKATAQHT